MGGAYVQELEQQVKDKAAEKDTMREDHLADPPVCVRGASAVPPLS